MKEQLLDEAIQDIVEKYEKKLKKQLLLSGVLAILVFENNQDE